MLIAVVVRDFRMVPKDLGKILGELEIGGKN